MNDYQWIAQFGFAAVVAFFLLRYTLGELSNKLSDIVNQLKLTREDMRDVTQETRALTQLIASEAKRSREDVIEAFRILIEKAKIN